jgi:transketolase
MKNFSENKLTLEILKQARKRLVTMHYQAKVGHTGASLSALDAIMVTFHDVMTTQDLFILSKGHAAGALYTALWSTGRLTNAELDTFHKDGTLLAGHPPSCGIPDIPFATGSLGHGLSLACGTAMGWKLQERPDQVFCLTSDGEWQEGATWEALIFACHQRLGNLTVMIDHNNLQGFGTTHDVASMSPLWDKVRGFDADIQIIDGHDIAAISSALTVPTKRPKLIFLKTTKGNGVSFMANQMAWHYLPMSAEQYQIAMKDLEKL